MTTDAIIELLGFANGNDRLVRVVLRDGTEVVGTPSSVDTHLTAYEVFLHPAGDDETEIGISLSAIVAAEMV
jgi:hypothetical protein